MVLSSETTNEMGQLVTLPQCVVALPTKQGLYVMPDVLRINEALQPVCARDTEPPTTS
jgi:hypothetical protein